MATPTTLPATFTAGQVLTAAQQNALRGAFRVLQVVSTNKADTFSTTSASFVDITGLSATITPSSATSKILVIANLVIGATLPNDPITIINLVRGSTSIAQGDASGSKTRGASGVRINNQSETQSVGISFLDSPATTSATTYKLQMQTSSNTSYVNRGGVEADTAVFGRYSSTITIMEISA